MPTLTLPPRSAILHGDCIDVLGGIPTGSIDFALLDPPYLVRYEKRPDETGLAIVPKFPTLGSYLLAGRQGDDRASGLDNPSKPMRP